MTVYNDTPSLAGAGGITVSGIERALIASKLWGAGSINGGAIERMKDGAMLAGKGLLDSWRICNLFEYDPSDPKFNDMAMRRARLSTEGILGDD